MTCPSCSARYLLSADAIGEHGKTVRCGKCRHIWEQPPVRDSLDELSETNFAGMEEPEVAPVAPPVDDIPDVLRPRPDLPPAFAPVTEPPSWLRLAVVKHLPRITGVVMACAIFGLILLGVISARGTIMNALPSTRALFVAMGTEHEAGEETLVFDKVTAKFAEDELNVTGSLINLSGKSVALPNLTVEILDSAGKLVKSLPAETPEKSLPGEESMELSFTFGDIPETAQQVRLAFHETAAEDPHESEEGHGEDKPTTDAEGADNTPAHSEGGSGHSTAHE